MKIIDSPANEIIKSLIPARRKKAGLVFVEGERTAAEALNGAWQIQALIMEQQFAETPAGQTFLRETSGEIILVNERVMAKLSSCDSAPGVGVMLEVPDRCAEPDCLQENRLLILDRVADPGNGGALIRSAYAFGFAVLFTAGGLSPLNEKLLRASAGYAFRPGAAAWQDDSTSIHSKLQENGFEVLLLEPKAEASLDSYVPEPGQKLALVLGEEASGIRVSDWPGARALRIPMRQAVESLNVSVSGAIALYHFSRTML